MSKSELGKGVAIRLIAAIVFGAIGYFAIYYALQMVAIFGEGMGVDARSRAIYASSHMIVHVFAAACAMAIGIFYFARNWVLFTLALLAIIGCGSYGIINMYGFASTNRVSVAAAKEAKNTAAERQYQAARTDLMSQIDWLQKTAAQEEGRERRRLLLQVDSKRKELSALKPPAATAETVISDPGASTFGELTGTDQRRWLLAFPMILAILMFFAESFSFVVVGHMLSGVVALFVSHRMSTVSPTVSGNPGSSGGGGMKRSQATDGKVKSQGETVAAKGQIVPWRKAEAPVASSPIHSHPPSLTEYLKQHAGITYTSQAALAKATGFSPATVHRELKRLEGRGKVKRSKHKRGANAVTYGGKGGLQAAI